MDFVFDPRDLIGPPFRTCPGCSQTEFGVVSIDGSGYSRRCRQCFHTERFPLWPTTKKVIYIDQFAISNMMKTLNVAMDSHERTKADPFWLELFETLERVCKLQLVVCPDSVGHRNESLMVPYFEPLKRMYEQLSHGVSFDSPEHIEQKQISVAAAAWARGERPQHDLDPVRVTSGRLHDWQDRVIVSVSGTYPPTMVDEIRAMRDRIHDEAQKVFEFYRTKGQTSFEYWREHERTHGGSVIVDARVLYLRRLQEMALAGKFELDRVYRSNGHDMFNVIVMTLERNGVAPADVLVRLRECLRSDAFKDSPAQNIGTLLWAVIAHRAANGQVRPPNRGMVNDISIVSTVLPYCDAMFIDNECRGLLANIPREFALPYPTRIFSKSNCDEFLSYLRDIEAKADPVVIESGREVYGDDWPRPFLTMFEEQPRRDERGFVQ